MQSPRKGFTLIELLIVIVIIGILAAIAIPKFGRTRERAHFKAVQTDLRNVMTHQEIYRSTPANGSTYSTTLAALTGLQLSQGVTVSITAAGNTGWGATAGHAALNANQTCAVFSGTISAIPSPAVVPGAIVCTNE